MEDFRFNPQVELTNEQRAQIAHTVTTPGYFYINRIMRAEVDKFIMDLINVKEDDDKMVVAKHKLSKAAAMYYQRIVDIINSEVQSYARDASVALSPEDPTEGLIDLGEVASMEDEEPNWDLELNDQLSEGEL